MNGISPMIYLMIILASYRLTHLIVFDKITEFMRKPFLQNKELHDTSGHSFYKKVPISMFGYLLNCFWCAGIWIAFLLGGAFLLWPHVMKPVVFILSIAGAQTILETAVGTGTKSIQLMAKKRDILEQELHETQGKR